jgi:hypothetical protein
VLGDGARIEFHPYALGQDFERLRRGGNAVAFPTRSELLANGLTSMTSTMATRAWRPRCIS